MTCSKEVVVIVAVVCVGDGQKRMKIKLSPFVLN